MEFLDRALVGLAMPDTRRTVFDDRSLRHLVEAAFDIGTLAADGPVDATFDDFRPGVFVPPRISVDGNWSHLGGADRVDAHLDATVPRIDGVPRIDATWVGTIVARADVAVDRIDDVDGAWIDIDPVSTRATGRLTVSFAPPAPAPTVLPSRSFPVAVGILVRDTATTLVTALAEAKATQWLLDTRLPRSPAPDLPARHPVVVAVVLPGDTFDDDTWPGASPTATPSEAREKRREAAATWLGPQGVVLVPFSPTA